MSPSPGYTDDELRRAVDVSHSWRETLRHLGLAGTSSAAIRSVRRHADRLQLDYTHFAGGRHWSDAELAKAVLDAATWTEVARRLQLTGSSATATLQRHAGRLGLEIAHLAQLPLHENWAQPQLANLRRAGSLIAAAWYTLCGQDVSWPLEPCRYDLVVRDGARMRRVQVKTTTVASESGVWQVNVSTTSRRSRRIYTADEVDDFFVIDGELNFYVIPLESMVGMHGLSLSAYERFRVRSGTVPHSLISPAPAPT
ncbi:group I intron-associated PD-(D/E)XK endonuclease [Flexivirga oryzae]|uniref:PD(D/E)XK endonuclease domain-containing protein n=1 Tax=Flexivirga oryzae TaxID=1794944 RepID=A0A839NAX1_9MICO|nr:group I intron-associated PD-(D/E)XK endonuclease [Flexivirga oryzae]MBB2891752.1 hypothetical protein [Flexivirga oryzae]